MSIKRNGYLWKNQGFTMTHLRTFTITFLLTIILGVGLAITAIVNWEALPQEVFYGLLALSGIVFMMCITATLGSIFTIIFYRFSKDMECLEDESSSNA